MATHSSILAWRIPWAEEPKWATVHGVIELWPYVPSSAYHSLRAGVISYSITVPTVGACKYLLKERKIRGESEEIPAVLKTSPWRGPLKPGGPITSPTESG